MAKPFALVTADWHLRRNSQIWSLRSDPKGDAAFNINYIADYAAEIGVKYMILAGDILDTPRSYSCCIEYLSPVSKWAKQSSSNKVLFVQGQHDFAVPPWLSLLEPNEAFIWLHLNTFTDPDTGIAFTGLDYLPYFNDHVSYDYMKDTVVITHQPWKDFTPGGNLYLRDFCQDCKLLIAGDHHAHTIKKLANYDLIIPGCIAPNNILEFLLTFGFYVVYIDSDLKFSYEFVELPRRPFVVLAETALPVERATQEYVEKKTEEFIRSHKPVPVHLQQPVVLIQGSSEYVRHVKSGLTSKFITTSFTPPTETDTLPERPKLEDAGSIRGFYINYYNKQHPKLARAVPSLLDAASGGIFKKEAVQKAVDILSATWESEHASDH